MITKDNIASHELIGLNTEIIKSTNQQVIGLNGRITNETKSMLTINTKKGSKSVAKSTSSWGFLIEGEEIIVNGSRIEKRSFDRLGDKA